jgi:hypothetical protein
VDHPALAGIDQQLGYLKIIGDHLQVVPVEDRPRQRQGGGAGIEIDAAVFGNETGRQRADGLFLFTLQGAFHQMTGLCGQPADGAHAARDADQQPLFFQLTDVPTDGHMGHAEDLRQLINAYRPTLLHQG